MSVKEKLKLLEGNIKKNQENEEARKKQLEEKKNKAEYNKKISEDRDKRLKEKEEKEKKEREEQKRKLKDEEEAKKKAEKERRLKNEEDDRKRIQKKLEDYRKKCGIKEENLWSQTNWKDKKKYWEELGLKEEDLLRKIRLKNYEQKKKEILHQQYLSRNKKDKADSSTNNINNSGKDYNAKKIEDNKKQKKLIEDMCIFGDIIKNEIIEEKENKENNEKYISIEDAIKTDDEDSSQFVLGLLATNLEKIGINTLIEKEYKKKEKNEEETKYQESNTLLQFVVNGLATKKKYEFHFDISEERNEELLTNEEEQKKFIDKLRTKLSKEYNISEDKIIITNPQRGSFKLTIIFQSEDFDLTKEELAEKFKDEPELVKLKEIHTDILLGACKISKDNLDNRGNNTDGGWGKGETRGGEKYIPPEGWKGYGLKVKDMYDNGNNDWLHYDNREGEWCIAYRPIKNDKNIDEAKINVTKIAKGNFKKGDNEKDEDEDEEDYSKHFDIRHPGSNNFVGTGVYCYQDPTIMEEFCGEININNETYKIGFMIRVNPEKIRMCAENTDLWVLNGNDDEIRPYRILVKKIE